MSAFAFVQWDYAERAERRYRRIIWTLVLVYLVVGVLIPFIKLIGLEKGGGDAGKTRYAQLVHPPAPIAQKEEEPAPAPPTPETQAPKPQKETKPKPEVTQQQKTQQARQVAQHSGLLALADQFADLRDHNLTQLDSSRPLRSSESAGGGDTSNDATAAFSSSAANGSGGITTNTPGSGQRYPNGTKLDARRTTTVKSPVGFGRDTSRPGESGDKLIAGRSIEEIQLTFDRSKAAFYAIFSRAQRDSPGMGAGKIVVSLTIAPDGSVTDCKLVSSSFGDPGLEGKIVQRVKLLNFGAKDVPVFTYPNYPINYLPS
jgi:protein TonB